MRYHRSVVQIKIYPLRHGESFHPSLLAFLFDWWTKRWEIAEEVSMNCMAFTYYITLISKHTSAWLLRLLILLPSALLLCTNSSQSGWFLWGAIWDISIFMHYMRREVKNKVDDLIYSKIYFGYSCGMHRVILAVYPSNL